MFELPPLINHSLSYILHDGVATIFAIMVMLSLITIKVRKDVRKTLRHTFGIYLFSLFLLVVAGVFHYFGNSDAAYITRNIAILLEGVALIKLGGVFLFQIILPLVHIHLPSILEDILAIIGYLIWAMVRLHYAGVDLSGIVTTSAVITAVIAFSMQDTLGNILGGVSIQIDKSIQIGDWIKVGDSVGRVVDIRWRSTAIETRNWETVIIPNSVLMKNTFSVLGRRNGEPEQWRRWVWFNVSYEIPPERVISVVDSAIRSARIPNVARRPLPNCVMMDFDKSTARYALRYWLTDLFADDPTDSSVRVHIFAALKREDIIPAIPEQTIHMIKETEKLVMAKERRELNKRIELLKSHTLFRSLNSDEIKLLAEHLKYTPYVAGDLITQQGSIAHWLYIMVKGTVQVSIKTTDGRRQNLNTISASENGTIIGEMGLMTGEARSATVEAVDEVVCYRIDKPLFEQILKTRPEIAEDLSAIIADRQHQLNETLEVMNKAQSKTISKQQQHLVLEKIRDFFGI